MNNIASERVKLGLRQRDLAEKLDVSLASITRWEKGKTEPTASALTAMCDLFGCSSDYLLGISENRLPSKA